MSLMGRRTCASASALYLDAQPEQVANVVNRILCSLGVIVFLQLVIINYNNKLFVHIKKDLAMMEKGGRGKVANFTG